LISAVVGPNRPSGIVPRIAASRGFVSVRFFGTSQPRPF
jgi:hypothetical protein